VSEELGSEGGSIEREVLIELITREVLAAIAADSDICDNPAAVRQVVANGADRVAFHGVASEVPLDLAKYIDHTLLKPEATAADIDQLADEAREYGFASVCVNPTWVKRAAERLRGSEVKTTAVIGFPLGANTPEIKAMETRRALRDGAREVDMVINIGALKSGDYETVRKDIEKVVDAAHEGGAIVKVILETSKLTDEEKVIASSLAKKAKADYVKTSTGFGGGGATVYDVALMRETIGPEMGVKASGGVRTAEEAEDMIAAGATRIGASAGVQIVGEAEGGGGGERY
jgi:deoxyribose-phosphate aldolase